MKKLILGFALLAMFGLVLVNESCRPDTLEFIPTSVDTIGQPAILPLVRWIDEGNNPAPTAIDSLTSQLAEKPYLDSITAENGGRINTPYGIVIIAAGSCNNPNGGAASGKLYVEFLVVQKAGSMIQNNRPTVTTDGQNLISGGEVYLRIFRPDGTTIALNQPARVRYKMTATVPNAAFFGFVEQSPTRFQNTWLSVTDSLVGVTTRRDTIRQQGTVSFSDSCFMSLRRLGWTNCDRFNNETNLTRDFCVSLPDTFNNSNTAVFMAFPDLPAAVRMVGDSATRSFRIAPNYRGVPIGRNVILVSVSRLGNDYYLGTRTTTVAASTTCLAVVPRLVTWAELIAYLGSL